MISVCMATHNGEKYIKDQILSILRQLENEDELIISDDSSNDKTIEIIEGINDKRIKILKGLKFESPKLNFENALKEAKGEFIFLSDQDDIWIEKKVKIMKNYLQEYDFVISDAIITDEFLSVIGESLYKTVNSRKGIIKNIYKNTYYGCCMALRRDILLKAFPFPKNKEIGHDLWLGLIAEKYGKIKFINDKLIYFRRHQSNVTSINKSNRNFLKKVIGRIIILYHYMKIGKKNI